MTEEKSNAVEVTKEELFAQDPDRFIDSRDIVVCVLRSPEGLRMACNPASRHEAFIAKGECELAIMRSIAEKSQAAREEKRVVVPPSGGIINAVRNRLVGRK